MELAKRCLALVEQRQCVGTDGENDGSEDVHGGTYATSATSAASPDSTEVWCSEVLRLEYNLIDALELLDTVSNPLHAFSLLHELLVQPQIVDCRLQTADCSLQIADYILCPDP